MKVFYTVNFPEDDINKPILDELRHELGVKNIEYKNLTSRDIVVDAGDGVDTPMSLVFKNEVVDLQDAYVWFRRNGNSRRMISIIATMLSVCGVEFTDPIKKIGKKPQAKPMQAVKLAGAKIRIPRTLIVTPASLIANREYIEQVFTSAFVLKADGSQGRNVWKLNNFDEILEKIKTQKESRVEVFVLQEVVGGAESDIRALFFKDKFLGAIRRKGEGFLNNYAQGGSVEEYKLTEADMDVCSKAQSISGLDYIGVDFMHDVDGAPVVIELQHGPGSVAMREVHPDLNIGKSIIDRLT